MILIQTNGATAKDDKDGDLTSKIETTGKVDTKKTGTYKITYTVKDSAGNVATASRTVIVKGENPPQENTNTENNNTVNSNTTSNEISNSTVTNTENNNSI